MNIRELGIKGAFHVKNPPISDLRGSFQETFRFDMLEVATGRPFSPKQMNTSVSASGVVRGIHFADIPPGQSKYVTCTSGQIIDYVVDIRVGSPTFGSWENVLLDSTDRDAIFISEGLGHCFVAVEQHSIVSYLVSEPYAPTREHGINPLDPSISLEFPFPIEDLIISPKDYSAPLLAEALDLGLLPDYSRASEYLLQKGGHN